MKDTTSYNQSFIDLCCLTWRLVFATRRLVFVTSRLVFVTCRLVFVTRRIQKWPYVKFSKSFIFISSSEIPTGILFPQSIHLCYIGVLWSIRVGNYLRSSFWLGECGFAKVVLIVDYVSPYSYDDSMCALWWLSYASMSWKIYPFTLETIQFSGRGYLENVTDSWCGIFNLRLAERWVPNVRLNLLGNSWASDALCSLLRVSCRVNTLRCGVGYVSL